jgi:uncharacterized membrane protein
MTSLIRRLRGAVSIGVAWGLLWVAIGLILIALIGVFRPQEIDPGEGPGKVLPILGLVGFLSGLGFAGLLSLAERRTRLHELSLTRVALWGLLGSAAIPLVMGTDGSMGWLTGPMGAIFATASVAIARRGTSRTNEESLPAV